MHSTVIVNRMDPAVIPKVSALFAELDATDFPHHMGTRRRQLFSLDGVYFHLQDFTTSDGYALIDQAWKEADPRFIKICRELEPLVKVYDPTSWRSTADQVATRVYRWEAPA
nr:TcmI family type II polyketide cyclase [Streptomyces sulphureus]